MCMGSPHTCAIFMLHMSFRDKILRYDQLHVCLLPFFAVLIGIEKLKFIKRQKGKQWLNLLV